MSASKKIKMCMVDKNIRMSEIAEKTGMARQSFYNKFQRDTMSFAYVEKIADCLGCDVVLRDRKTGKEYN